MSIDVVKKSDRVQVGGGCAWVKRSVSVYSDAVQLVCGKKNSLFKFRQKHFLLLLTTDTWVLIASVIIIFSLIL